MRSNEVGPEGLQEMELNLKADIIFPELPPIVNTALLNFRRVVVRKNGEIRPLPYDPDEFVEPDDISCRINPVNRRILRALEKERTRMEQMFERGRLLDGDKENVLGHKYETATKTPQARPSPTPVNGKPRKQFSNIKKQDSNVEALLALGLTEAQIDRLYNSPLWTAHPVNKSEEQDSSETQELEQCQPKTKDGSSEQVWEVALILRSGVVRNNRSKGKQYTVIWKDWPWNDFSILAPHCFNNCKKLLAVDRREHLISQMALCMRENDERRFQELFPMFAKRHDYTNYHRVRLRMIEQSINDDLEELDIAPVYFENWTEDECATIDIKYLLKCTMSFSNYCEANAIGLALRLDYPENAAGCDCKGGQCTTSCPCIKVMGEGRIRVRNSGKVDVEKLAEAATVGCGTTCPCSLDCPSRLAERGRTVPLVVLYTTVKGWCVYTPQFISKGTFLGAYTGEIIPLCSAIEKGLSTTYQFTNVHQIPGAKQYVVDASRMGNVTRFFNHACGDAANLKAVSLLSRGNLLTNDMLFFTKRNISKGEELTFSYHGKDSKNQKNGMQCLCTPGCSTLL